MEQKKLSKLPDVQVMLNCLVGTCAMAIRVNLKDLCRRAGINYKKTYRDIACDFNSSPPHSLTSGIDDNTIGNEDFIPAKLPKDKTSRKEAEERG